MALEMEMAIVPLAITVNDTQSVEQCDKTAYKHQTADLVDEETDTLLNKSKKLQAKKLAISKEVQKSKFKFNTKGKLRKEEIVELKRNPQNQYIQLGEGRTL